MLIRTTISTALAAALLAGAPARADDTVSKVIGAIAQGVLAQQQAEHEQALWSGVVRKGTAAAYRQYLDTYPNSRHAAEARQRLARMGQPVTANSRAEITAAQRNLGILGYYAGKVDGVAGRGTSAAISAWQAAHGMTRSGVLTADQSRRLAQEAKARGNAAQAPSASQGSRASEIALGLTRAQRVQIQADLNTLGHDVGTPDGLFGSGTRRGIAAFQAAKKRVASGYLTQTDVTQLRADAAARGGQQATGPNSLRTDAMEEELAGLERADRVAIQRRLTELGYSTNGVDGAFGQGTRRAIRRWQGDNGLRATGYLTADQIRRLNAQRRSDTATPAAQPNEDTLAATEQRLLPDQDTRRLVEQRLSSLGLYRGTVDGVFTSATRTAIRQYQSARGISPASGYVDTATLTRMVSEAR